MSNTLRNITLRNMLLTSADYAEECGKTSVADLLRATANECVAFFVEIIKEENKLPGYIYRPVDPSPGGVDKVSDIITMLLERQINDDPRIHSRIGNEVSWRKGYGIGARIR